MKGKNKCILLASIITIISLVIGCKHSNKNYAKESIEDRISLTEAMNQDNISYDKLKNTQTSIKELDSIATELFGKGTETDKKANYVEYTNDYINININVQGTFPDISELNQDDADRDIKRVKYLKAFYDFVISEYDFFVEENLVKDIDLDNLDIIQKDFNKLEKKYRDFIHSSYIEGKSKQAINTYFDVTAGITREGRIVYNLIDIYRNIEKKSEIKNRINEEMEIKSNYKKEYEEILKEHYISVTNQNIKE